ncbi:ATPase domain-containing protein [Paraburkholderia sp. BL25I1N1]|uniref:ATPase domain-containing protein n=1 Tax=Paraburkholderia sp. BL25I1N1 TaxID=1938804 RepID=UPI000D051A0D|nr:ATPase domain-containing protein [Paraburkholderia sp. BL25I1N1]PRY06143.1 circadian clock protein KaiC [Paraburkholderia sp. BL25I1N1]
MVEVVPLPLVLTGIPELDFVLRGGLPKYRLHLIEGAPGTGKTTIALRFLIDGVRNQESCLYVTFSESTDELVSAARTHGWDVGGIDFFELVPDEAQAAQQQTVLLPAEIELDKTVQRIIARIEATHPDRIVIDSVSELRLLAHDPFIYRRQLSSLKRFLQGRCITTILLDDLRFNDDGELQSLVHGVISLSSSERDYGAGRRRLRIAKMRGTNLMSGWHDYALVTGEVLVFPSLIANDHTSDVRGAPLRSGSPGLDEILGSGLDRGTTTMLIGPSGAGKSSLALSYALAGARNGEHAAYFSFDEAYEIFVRRGQSLGLDPQPALASGQLAWQRMNPSRISPGEFVWAVRREVEDKNARVVVIDSINSYLSTMPEERSLIAQLHELLTYLNRRGVVTLLLLAQQGVLGDVENPVDLSFLSDTVLLLRFFEAAGQLRRAVTVIKRRTGAHDTAIHEFRLSGHGVEIGRPLRDLHGIFSGVPTYSGSPDNLIDDSSVA